MRWRLYYGDGSTYSDRDGPPFQAPTTNCVVLAEEDDRIPKGFGLTHGKSAFYWDDEIGWWNGCDEAGMWDYLLMRRGRKYLVFGRTIRNDAFWAQVARAGKEGFG